MSDAVKCARPSWLRRCVSPALAVIFVFGCSSQTVQSDVKPKVGRADAYATGIAAWFYCTCERWPRTWSELAAFDGELRLLAERAGKPAVPRFAWGAFPDARLGTSADEGYLTIDFGPSKETEATDVAVPFPDCSHFDRKTYVAACPSLT